LQREEGRIAAAARLLAEVRRGGRLIEALPEAAAPRDLAEAIAMQEALAALLGLRANGWKIGATQPDLQAKIGLAEPFFGRVFGGTVRASGADICAASGRVILEAELAVRLGSNFDPRKVDWNARSIDAAIDEVIPCIEINRPSFRNPFAMRGLDVIADNGSNAGLVLGAPIADRRRLDLAAIAVTFRLGGAPMASGIGANVMGHPLAALAWLANDRARRARPLAAGELVATGSMMGFVEAKPGDRAEADFGAHGTVACRVVA
jgi:2-oxo-3-hexenedioate decarboxylase/2-keto-4-pentenoate hydratase